MAKIDLNNLTINPLHHLLPTISINGHLHHQLHKNSQESLPSKLNIESRAYPIISSFFPIIDNRCWIADVINCSEGGGDGRNPKSIDLGRNCL
nr:hypothetical protein Itr_chr10CG13980 [Ipomoea trifida]